VWFPKMRARTRYTEVEFLHSVGSAGRVVHSGASEATKHDTLFFMLSWDQYEFDKKHVMTHYAELLGHVVHSGALGPRNFDALFFMLGWHQYRFDKKARRDTLL
jgi:hypothetical protein